MKKYTFIVLLLVFSLVVTSSLTFAQEKKIYEGVTITIATLAGGVKGGISGPRYFYRDAWEKLTGGKVNIVEIPFAQLTTKIKTDLITGAGKYDILEPCGTMYGDLIAGNFIIPLDDYYNDQTGKFPKWDINQMGPPLAKLYQWGGKLYGVMNDADSWIIYGNKDAFNNPDHQAKFKEKYGYDLTWPPKTTDEYLDYSEFFNGWDWDNDGEIEYGNVMPLRVGAQGIFYFFAWLAPYITLPGPVVDAYHNTTFFNPETMEPAINNPGAVKALEDYVRLFKSAPEASLGWDLAEGWDWFLKGNAALSINPGDIGSLAQEAEKSKIQGKLLCSTVPGRTEIWNREKNDWEKFDKIVKVGNTIGCSWHAVISRFSKNPEAAYHFLSFIAQRENLEPMTYSGWDGIDFGKIYDFPPEISNGKGTGSIQGYLDAGWNKDDVLSFLSACWENYYEMDAYQEFFRIPAAQQFINSLDVHVSNALVGSETPEAALAATEAEWNKLLDTFGKETVQIYYQQSVGFGEAPPKYME